MEEHATYPDASPTGEQGVGRNKRSVSGKNCLNS